MKSLQWHYVNSCSKENFVVILGVLHTEMTFITALVDSLENSGWSTVIMNAGVARSGVAQSLVLGLDVARTKYVISNNHMLYQHINACIVRQIHS